MNNNEQKWTSMNKNEQEWTRMSSNEQEWTIIKKNKQEQNLNEEEWTKMNNYVQLVHLWETIVIQKRGFEIKYKQITLTICSKWMFFAVLSIFILNLSKLES